MSTDTLSGRLSAALRAANLSPAELSRRVGTSETTISNWLNGTARTDHVKAESLFAIADAVGVDARYLLQGGTHRAAVGLSTGPSHTSQDLQLDTLTIAFQLVEEGLDGLQLPPQKRAELTKICLELLEEELPRAKVLRFVRAAAA